MKNLLLAISLCFVFPFISFAQSDEDALRYSQITLGGTARALGCGGAFSSLGADFSTISQNPAGLGWYRGSELSFTPTLVGIDTKSSFIDGITDAQKYKFNVGSFGVVISNDLNKKHQDSKWKYLNIGFGANRLNNFNSTVHFNGFNLNNSLVDYYLQLLNSGTGTPEADIHNNFPFSAGLGYEGFLVNPVSETSNFYNSVIPDGHVQQDGLIESQGGTTEYGVSIAGNYDNRLFLGMTLGMPAINYSTTNSYYETDASNSISNFKSFTLTDYLSTTGYGFNGKIGAQYKVNDFFQIGASVHTPTYYNLTDAYNSSIASILDTTQGASYTTPAGSYNYSLISPWRVMAGASFIFKQSGFLSLDYELINYNQMHYNFNKTGSVSDLDYESIVNNTIKDKYKATSNLRIGGEYALNIFRFRLGAAFYQSPFKSGVAVPDFNLSNTSITGGFGVRGNNIYCDVAYVHSATKQFYQPYSLTDESVTGVGIKKNTGTLALTIGYRY
ncbi:MAG: hypothetical protein H0W62_05070 [Chitinophagales bacterium]|nr:hypothetical protein [Chitinophagales bacterium]